MSETNRKAFTVSRRRYAILMREKTELASNAHNIALIPKNFA